VLEMLGSFVTTFGDTVVVPLAGGIQAGRVDGNGAGAQMQGVVSLAQHGRMVYAVDREAKVILQVDTSRPNASCSARVGQKKAKLVKEKSPKALAAALAKKQNAAAAAAAAGEAAVAATTKQPAQKRKMPELQSGDGGLNQAYFHDPLVVVALPAKTSAAAPLLVVDRCGGAVLLRLVSATNTVYTLQGKSLKGPTGGCWDSTRKQIIMCDDGAVVAMTVPVNAAGKKTYTQEQVLAAGLDNPQVRSRSRPPSVTCAVVP
jgi:hypothetical protein